jgi:type IV fimbrial biogenesis protein FimT
VARNGGMRRRGFTVVEMLITLAVAAVVVSLALPEFNRMVGQHVSAAAANQLAGAVALARSEAILRRTTVTMCPGARGRCLDRDQWHLGTLVFLDGNGNGQIDGDDRVVRALPALRRGARVYWRSFRNRSYLQFQPRGYTQWQNGTLLYCPPEGRLDLARLVILNAGGRTRPGVDSDGDGIVNRPGGDNVRCPA